MNATQTPYYIIRDALCRAEIIAGATQLIGQIAVPLENARAALAELERAAQTPAAPVAEIREVVVTDEMADRVHRHYFLAPGVTSGAELGRQIIAAVRAELGPALGLAEIREPMEEECDRIEEEYARNERRVYTRRGRDMADAVRSVMFPQKSGVGL